MGIPAFLPSRISPASFPAIVESKMPSILNLRECLTSPAAVFPPVRLNDPSQRTKAVSMDCGNSFAV